MRSSLIPALCLVLAGAAQAQDLNVISSVEVKDAGGSVLVTVKGSKPPNFTTFSMADPARFVIDLSEARFQGVPEDMRVDDGVIRVVKNLAYGSGASAIARVMIAFVADVEPPDVQSEGNSLTVRVAKPGGAAVAATGTKAAGAPSGAAAGAGEAAASGAAAAGAGAAGAAVATAAALARSDEEEAARKEALAREQREAEAREQARVAAEATAKEREAQARAEAEARAREAETLAAQQAAADEAARVAAEARRNEIKAKAAVEAALAQKLQEEPPAAAPAAPAAPAMAAGVAAMAAPTPSPEDPAARAEAERATRAQAKADAKARREIDEALAAQQAAEGRAPVAAAPPPAAPPITAAAAAATVKSALAASAASSRPAKLQAVGFKQLPTVSRVFVKTNVPPRFTISDVGDDVVRLEVENTRSSRRNDTRPLDTSFFPSAVAMITPSKQGTSYVVDIKLRKRVPYQQKVEGDVVAIDFERPPGGDDAAPARPAAAAGTPAPGPAQEEMLDNAQGMVVAPDDKAEGAEPSGDPEPAPKQ